MRFIVITPLVVAISLIILDNHFIYESMIKSKNYFLIREKVRSFKSKSGLKYQGNYTGKDNSNIITENVHSLNLDNISSKAFPDESKITLLKSSNRLKQLKNFLEIYRNSSYQSNTILLGDLVHEFLGSQVDTLFVPFTSSDYCNEFANTLWCQIESLSWFIYPSTVERFDDYPYQISESQYKSIKRNSITFETSDSTLINILIPNPDGQRQNYYLFGYEKEIFVYPLNNFISG